MSFFTDDNRFNLELLGRGAPETGWALSICTICILFYLNRTRSKLVIDFYKILITIFLILIILTQSRSALLFISIYFLISARRLKYFLPYITLFLAVIIILFNKYFETTFVQLFKRSASSNVLTGREFIWGEKFIDLQNNGILALFFGSDFTPKITVVETISYQTADTHNLLLDYIQYFGVIFTIIFLLWYFSTVKSTNVEGKSIIVAFFVTVVFVSPFRYSLLPYANVLILGLPIYIKNYSPKNSLRALKNRKNYTQPIGLDK